MTKIVRVDVPILDVWSKSSSRSERTNQLIYNERVIPLSARGQFVHVRCEHGYKGWVRADHLANGDDRKHKWFVDVPVASLLDGKTGKFVGKLSFGTRISIEEETESFGRLPPIPFYRIIILSSFLAKKQYNSTVT